MTSSVNESLLDERLARLERAKPWSPRVISKLEAHIRTGDDDALFRINPLRFGTEKNIAENEASGRLPPAATTSRPSRSISTACSSRSALTCREAGRRDRR